jgi:phytoene synthase
MMQEAVSEPQDVSALAVGSNLAIALRVLPQSRRRDMQIFYAFCRLVDDLADEPHFSEQERRAGLLAWRRALERNAAGSHPGEPALAAQMRQVLWRHGVPVEWAQEVVAGCEMDLGRVRYETWEQLRVYCYRVASAVGLVSARIFGAQGCESYAVDLGLALQLTNILRDSAEDYVRSDRVYLPTKEREMFGVGEGAWVHGRPAGWESLMRLQTERAREFYQRAQYGLPDSERKRMVSAEMMRAVYEKLLNRMEADGFEVWRKRYRLSGVQKVLTVATAFLRVMCAHLTGRAGTGESPEREGGGERRSDSGLAPWSGPAVKTAGD